MIHPPCGLGGLARDAHLDERGQNLAIVLQEYFVQHRLAEVDKYLAEFSAEFKGVKPRYRQGRFTPQLEEHGLLDPVPAPRISDGTLKFLCLLAVLLDPNPPPMICIGGARDWLASGSHPACRPGPR